MVFHIDNDYHRYVQNKRLCKKENPQKYFCQSDFRVETKRAVNQYLLGQLLKEYPAFFKITPTISGQSFRNLITNEQFSICPAASSTLNDQSNGSNRPNASIGKSGTGSDLGSIPSAGHGDPCHDMSSHGLFDALCMQVQEDVAVWQFDVGRDWLAAVHLSAPNYWSAEEKVGKNFSSVHEPVPEMDKLKKHYRPMLEAIIGKDETFTRFGWGIATDDRLNHHPSAPGNVIFSEWYGRNFNDEPDSCFIRVERQNLIGIKAANALIFTIRTYFYALADLSGEEKMALAKALRSMSEKTLEYKELSGKLYSLLAKLS